jgi:hypothetical protein
VRTQLRLPRSSGEIHPVVANLDDHPAEERRIFLQQAKQKA